MNKNWLELIEKKYDEIINVGEKAYKDELEFMADEYARSESINKLDALKEQLSYCE